MDELISRKAAIDAIMDADVCVTWNGVISDDDAVDIAIKSTKGCVISSIVNMPSAQPETHEKRTETHECDCISRKDAIDALWQEREMLDSLMDDFLRKGMPIMRSNTKIERNRVENDIFIINQLPSAQPDLDEVYAHAETEAEARYHAEIVRCKDCKHHHYEGNIPYCDRIDYGYGWGDDDYCSRAERRKDDGFDF